jgi:hypothetical protein
MSRPQLPQVLLVEVLPEEVADVLVERVAVLAQHRGRQLHRRARDVLGLQRVDPQLGVHRALVLHVVEVLQRRWGRDQEAGAGDLGKAARAVPDADSRVVLVDHLLASRLLPGVHMDAREEVLAPVVVRIDGRGQADPNAKLAVVVGLTHLARLRQVDFQDLGGAHKVHQRLALVAALDSCLLGFRDLRLLAIAALVDGTPPPVRPVAKL